MKLSVLLSSVGRRVELLQIFRSEAISLGVDLTIIAADLDPKCAPACYFADVVEAVPPVGSPEYGDALLGIVARRNVSLVVPLIDPDVTAWSLIAGRAASECGCRVAVASPEAVAICRDKAQTAVVLEAGGLCVPWTRRSEAFDPTSSGVPWPLVCKPASGSSSVGLRVLGSAEQARLEPPAPGTIVQEQLFGAEVTVNVFYDRGGRLLYAIPHRRQSVRSGEVSRGITFAHDGLMAAAEQIGVLLPGVWGPLCFQAMLRADNTFGIFEINARFGGGYPLAQQAGAMGVRYLLQDVLGSALVPVSKWRKGVCMLRYDQSVFTVETDAL